MRCLEDPRSWSASPRVRRRWRTEIHIQLGKHPLWIVRHKTSPCRATLYILLRHGGKEGLAKGTEELELAHVVDMRAHQVFNLATVRLLQWPKAVNIKWLEVVGGMRRHAERDDVLLLVVALELGRVVAFMAVEDQQPVFALCPARYVMAKVLDPV